MSASVLSTHANEGSTFAIIVAFTDEDGNAKIPNTGLKWHLTNITGHVINGRLNVGLTPAASVTIVLQGSDLMIENQLHHRETRALTVEGTYDGNLGTNLPLNAEAQFLVDNLTKIPSS